MIDFTVLKKSYITTIQFGLLSNTGYCEVKRGNEVLHKFCEYLIDNSNCSESEKHNMKLDLELLKETLTKEIEKYYPGDLNE
ncbi:MAG: hypothetical protein IJH56_02220 [Firmicutes bacterium]|nr:hypothetical protein [Bacillota bacterium]